jgi:DNA-binding PadR family transcriptional regulator
MTSQVNWALLGLVIDRAGYGYELMRRLERDFGDVLSLGSESHVYTALNELERRALIEEISGTRSPGTGKGRQPKPSYRATAKGLNHYRERLLAQVCEDRRQSRLFVRQLAILGRDPAAALEVIERYEQACLEETSRNKPAAASSAPRASLSSLTSRLISEESRLAMGARLPWVEYARAEFDAILE